MKYAYDFKQIARDSLFGEWKTAFFTGVVASSLGASLYSNSGISLPDSSASSDSFNSDILDNITFGDTTIILLSFLIIVLLFVFLLSIAQFFIGGAATLGYAKYNLNLVDKKDAKFSDLFSQFNRFGSGLLMNLLTSLYLTLWFMLFIIPGIVKTYSYAMTPFIVLEHPEMTINEAITESRRIMNGNRWRLFCLEFSFIGWRLLCILPMLLLLPFAMLNAFGLVFWLVLSFAIFLVGNCLINTYFNVAFAAFYREITHTPLHS